jgi:hypothetical protein
MLANLAPRLRGDDGGYTTGSYLPDAVMVASMLGSVSPKIPSLT